MRRSLIAGLVAAPVIALTTLAIVTSGSADAEGATLAAGKFRAYQPGATAIALIVVVKMIKIGPV